MWGLAARFALWVLGLITGKGRAATPAPTPTDDIVRAAPTMAATAARDEQALSDDHINQQAKEAARAQADDASAAAASARADIVRSPTAIDANPAGHWRDT